MPWASHRDRLDAYRPVEPANRCSATSQGDPVNKLIRHLIKYRLSAFWTTANKRPGSDWSLTGLLCFSKWLRLCVKLKSVSIWAALWGPDLENCEGLCKTLPCSVCLIVLTSHTLLSPQSCHAYPAPLSQRNITVSYKREREREGERGGGNFFKVEWEMQLRLPGITHEKFQQQQQINKRATPQLISTCCAFKLIRQDVPRIFLRQFTSTTRSRASSQWKRCKREKTKNKKQRHTGYKTTW